MAKKLLVNQSAEIRAILEQLGKDATFKQVFEQLQARHKSRTFNENSCQQAFAVARKKLGFAKGPRRRKEPVPMSARVVPANRPAAQGAKGLVVDAITTAQKLIAVCGGKEAAKQVIDNVTT